MLPTRIIHWQNPQYLTQETSLWTVGQDSPNKWSEQKRLLLLPLVASQRLKINPITEDTEDTAHLKTQYLGYSSWT